MSQGTANIQAMAKLVRVLLVRSVSARALQPSSPTRFPGGGANRTARRNVLQHRTPMPTRTQPHHTTALRCQWGWTSNQPSGRGGLQKGLFAPAAETAGVAALRGGGGAAPLGGGFLYSKVYTHSVAKYSCTLGVFIHSEACFYTLGAPDSPWLVPDTPGVALDSPGLAAGGTTISSGG